MWVSADDVEAAEEGGWSGSVDLGYLASSGNTETSSLNFGVAAEYETLPWIHNLSLSTVRATDSGATTAERLQATYKVDYELNEHDYVYGSLAYEKDRFSGLDRRTSETVGYGRRVLDDERHELDLEAGLGASQLERSDGTSQREMITRLFGDYRWKVSDNASIQQKVLVEAASQNTYLESVSSMRAAINDSLALKLSYTVKRNSEVTAGRENTDTYTSVAISYSF